ncbi:hypothetical protein EP47_10570 [Legionella norrlandica]|uniref:Uncharacterized protein n=1 Tax=Legionella norrlandica TaxID=1498499 RepID=A0A0A2SSF4_9GAMM|nr:hypothetical protein [Legionella norrlandica]KGP62661.1 hypothetical protein EP47_10570 [Legionella norrlandica]
MKTVIILIIYFFSFQLQAACKCNCDPADPSLCANQNDLEHPCPVVCSSPAPGMAPMFTACPVSRITDPVTGIIRWVNTCN